MNTALVTNLATYVLLLILLTVVPMLPGMFMKRFLTDGLAVQDDEPRPNQQ